MIKTTAFSLQDQYPANRFEPNAYNGGEQATRGPTLRYRGRLCKHPTINTD